MEIFINDRKDKNNHLTTHENISSEQLKTFNELLNKALEKLIYKAMKVHKLDLPQSYYRHGLYNRAREAFENDVMLLEEKAEISLHFADQIADIIRLVGGSQEFIDLIEFIKAQPGVEQDSLEDVRIERHFDIAESKELGVLVSELRQTLQQKIDIMKKDYYEKTRNPEWWKIWLEKSDLLYNELNNVEISSQFVNKLRSCKELFTGKDQDILNQANNIILLIRNKMRDYDNKERKEVDDFFENKAQPLSDLTLEYLKFPKKDRVKKIKDDEINSLKSKPKK